MQSEWNLHYARWMIEDGQSDRRVGEVFRWFALEFRTERPLVRASENKLSAVPIDDYLYRVVAQVTYVTDRSCIIDFGLRATSSLDRLAERCRTGDFVMGDVYLELPLCIGLLPEEELRSLRHEWRVNRISADITPYVSRPDNPRYYFRDASRARFSDVTDTGKVRTHSYVLHCTEIRDSRYQTSHAEVSI
jgi:hypothetical protein